MSKRPIAKIQYDATKHKHAALSCQGCGQMFNSDRALTRHIDMTDFCRNLMRYGSSMTRDSNPCYIIQNGQMQPLNPVATSIAYEHADQDPIQFVNECFETSDVAASSNHAPFSPNVDAINAKEIPMALQNIDNKVYPTWLSQETIVCIELLYMLKQANVPLYMFDKIILWAKDAILRGETFTGKIPTRVTMVNKIQDLFNTQDCKPCTIPYQLEGGGVAEVVIFNFKAMLKSLLMDPRLMQKDNVVISDADPTKYQDQYTVDGTLDEIHQGDACKKCQAQMCLGPKDVFCGLVLYIDGTTLGPFTSGMLEPVMMSLTIFNRQTRYKAYAWRPIGFIQRPPDKDLLPGKKKVTRGRATRNYHRALRLILAGIKQEQDRGGVKTDLLVHRSMHKDMILKIPIVVVLGDCEGADVLCGRYKSHLLNVKSLCRDCDCPTLQADNPNYACIPRKRIDLFGATDTELQQMSHYRLENAFDEIQMADSIEGISGATPPELLHWLDAGLKKTKCNFFYSNVLGSGPVMNRFDSTLGIVSIQSKHQSDRNMPLITFDKGYAHLTSSTIKSGQYTGLMLGIVITWHTHAGRNAYAGNRYKDKRDLITDFTNLMEMTLCLEQWMKTAPKHTATIDQYQNSFHRYMVQYSRVVDKTDGNGLKTTKFHQIAHIVRYIKKFGNPQNINTARPENSHIENVKKPARRTQKRPDVLATQTACQYHEHYSIDLAKMYINDDEWITKPKAQPNNNCLQGTTCFIEVKRNDNDQLYYDIDFNKDKTHVIDSDLLQYLGEYILKWETGKSITIGSEVCINDILYRAHPFYRSKSPWFDYCYYQSNRMQYKRIAKILTFVQINNEVSDALNIASGVYAICICATDYPMELSVLVKSSFLSFDEDGKSQYTMLSLHDIKGPAYCIENVVDKSVEYNYKDCSQVFVVDSLDTWKTKF